MKNPPKFGGQIIYCDIDDTLVSWEHYSSFKEGMIEFIDPDDGKSLYLEVIQETVDALKRHKLRGHTIILWSQGGADWCEEVAKKLHLTETVDAYMSKPTWIYDDCPASHFIPESIRKDLRKKK